MHVTPGTPEAYTLLKRTDHTLMIEYHSPSSLHSLPYPRVLISFDGTTTPCRSVQTPSRVLDSPSVFTAHVQSTSKPHLLRPPDLRNPFTVCLTNWSSASRGSHPDSDKLSFPRLMSPPRNSCSTEQPGAPALETPHTALLGESDMDPR